MRLRRSSGGVDGSLCKGFSFRHTLGKVVVVVLMTAFVRVLVLGTL